MPTDPPRSPRGPRHAASPVPPADDATDARRLIEQLFATHYLATLRLAALLVDDIYNAEDVVQEAFAALYRNLDGLRTPDVAAAYLRTSVVNRSRSMLRRRQVRRRLDHGQFQRNTEPADTEVLRAEEYRLVADAVRTLPIRNREVIVLRYWSGLSDAEIAEALGITPAAVTALAVRGRAAIRRALKESSG